MCKRRAYYKVSNIVLIWALAKIKTDKQHGFRFTRFADLISSEVIWKSVKGEEAIMPAPRRSAFVKITDEDEEKITDQKLLKNLKKDRFNASAI